MGQDILNNPGPSWVQTYNNAKNGITVWCNDKDDPGFLSGRHTFKNFKLAPYTKGGKKDPNSLYYENSGVENIIPMMYQTELIN